MLFFAMSSSSFTGTMQRLGGRGRAEGGAGLGLFFKNSGVSFFVFIFLAKKSLTTSTTFG